MKKPKVAYSARAIMMSLWGPKGRPETNEYIDRCAEQLLQRQAAKSSSLRIIAEIIPQQEKPVRLPEKPLRLPESKRTADKWAAARARHGVQS